MSVFNNFVRLHYYYHILSSISLICITLPLHCIHYLYYRGVYQRTLEMANHHTGYRLDMPGQESFTIIQYNPDDQYTWVHVIIVIYIYTFSCVLTYKYTNVLAVRFIYLFAYLHSYIHLFVDRIATAHVTAQST